MRPLSIFVAALILGSIGAWHYPPARRALELLDTTLPTPIAISCPDHAAVEAIRADPTAFDAHYADCRATLMDVLPGAGDEEAALVYAALVARGMAPYGENTARNIWPDLTTSPALHCGNYATLAMLLYAQSGYRAPDPVYRVSWSHPWYGDHSMVALAMTDGRGIIVDPTIRSVARASFVDVLSGMPVPNERIVAFAPGVEPRLTRFQRQVWAAWRAGAHAPGDLLEYTPTP